MPQVWYNGHDWVIADSAEQAKNFLINDMDYDPDDVADDEWEVLATDCPLKIDDGEGNVESKTVAEWLAQYVTDSDSYPSLLASVDY